MAANGVCFKDSEGNLCPTTFVGHLGSWAEAYCWVLAEQSISRQKRQAGKVVQVRLVEEEVSSDGTQQGTG